MKKYILIIIACLACLFAVHSILKTVGIFDYIENPLLNQPAPNFTLPTASGQTINMEEYRDGGKAIIFFWATWCPHCRVELSRINAERQSIEASGVKIILVDVGENAEKLRTYKQQHKISLPILLDRRSDIADQYKIIGVPSVFFVDEQGIVRHMDYELPPNYLDFFNTHQ